MPFVLKAIPWRDCVVYEVAMRCRPGQFLVTTCWLVPALALSCLRAFDCFRLEDSLSELDCEAISSSAGGTPSSVKTTVNDSPSFKTSASFPPLALAPRLNVPCNVCVPATKFATVPRALVITGVPATTIFELNPISSSLMLSVDVLVNTNVKVPAT